SIDIEHDFAPMYAEIEGKEALIKSLKTSAKKAAGVYLATDTGRCTLDGNVYRRFDGADVTEKTLTDEEIPAVLAEVFGLTDVYYQKG
ncbi:MAG: hypothetical protein IJB52_14475, partial [Clostridia bacterium]|nr:hypothetical protein [Clostridia bacterium]